jgi:hypothetical protein
MNRSMRSILTFMLLLAVSGAAQAAESPWFDLANCAFCKHLTTDPELLPNLGWEHHLIKNGMMSIVTFRTEHARTAFAEANEHMEAASKEMMAGKQLPMCAYCRSMTDIFMTGKAEYEEVKGQSAHIMLITSDDPQVVEMIHKHGQRTIDEVAAMEAMEKTKE